MRPQLESITLPVDGSIVAAIRQRDPAAEAAPRMLCIHGWLDNANSFVPLMPYLPAFDLVAIDLPGHGYSDALPQGYSLHEMSYQLTAVIEALGWTDCHLVGHSLGGTIATLLSVANPDIVQSLTLVDSSGPLSEEADQLPVRMVRALQDRRRPQRFTSRVFPNKESAIKARLSAAKMHPHSAKLIIDRQLMQTEEGYRWRFDPRWRYASSQYQTQAQVQAILSAVACKTLTIIADDGFLASRADTEERLNCLQMRQSTKLPGHHHLHMDTPEPVAASINRFLEALPDLGG
ncbi:alpha/beta fold hydrolase [Granulosicoccus antarcticus]|uniref:2-(Acetamidomethylene)succinate hydrolase n=1 Tax=Granulosicoccus antarcticus IMCC3135 TaxID=1192854 RepID=A0A2Z2NTU9_9GAMM|nr:alpha/beta hydrolase [Granulosicoccus antarcticus]ASJ71057.1 2-(acetamidomethylene)succinate hydrolase [Granulosicoccus antarcticus IMCC3135]